MPTKALDRLAEARIIRLVAESGQAPSRDELRTLIARVEVHATRVHIFLRRRALAGLTGRRASVESIRARLVAGDRVIADSA